MSNSRGRCRVRERIHGMVSRTFAASILPLLPALLYALNILMGRVPGLTSPLEELWLEILSSRMSLPVLICLLLVLPFGVMVYGFLVMVKQRHYFTGGIVVAAGSAVFLFNLLVRSV